MATNVWNDYLQNLFSTQVDSLFHMQDENRTMLEANLFDADIPAR